MLPVLLLRQAVACHRPAPRVVGIALLIAAITVLTIIGIWASRLGSPPTWAVDCSDPICTDLWISARRRYLTVAAIAAVGAVAGWGLCGLAVPRACVPARAGDVGRNEVDPLAPAGRHPGRARFLRYVGIMVAPTLLLFGAGWSAIGGSRPLGLALACIANLGAALATWRWIRPDAASDRGAYWWAGVAAGAPLAVIGLLALHPAVFLSAVVLLAVPLAGVPLLCLLLVASAAVTGRLLPRTTTPQQAFPPPTPDRHSSASTATAVAAVAAIAVFGAWPVDAPPADASDHSAATGSVAPRGEDAGRSLPGTAAPGGVRGVPSSSPSTAAASAPATDATGLPACSPTALQVTASGWDSWTGNSSVTLTATNIGPVDCALRGTPQPMLVQGGEEIIVHPVPLEHLEAPRQSDAGVGLHPGDSARSRLYWPGYRNAADQQTPQTLTLYLAPPGEPVAVELRVSNDLEPGPAPFDLKAGVEGGAIIEVGAWEDSPDETG